jgi:hypothetical protein
MPASGRLRQWGRPPRCARRVAPNAVDTALDMAWQPRGGTHERGGDCRDGSRMARPAAYGHHVSKWQDYQAMPFALNGVITRDEARLGGRKSRVLRARAATFRTLTRGARAPRRGCVPHDGRRCPKATASADLPTPGRPLMFKMAADDLRGLRASARIASHRRSSSCRPVKSPGAGGRRWAGDARRTPRHARSSRAARCPHS